MNEIERLIPMSNPENDACLEGKNNTPDPTVWYSISIVRSLARYNK
jgi:hypothetical protein